VGGTETRRRLAEALERSGEKTKASYQRGLYFMATQQPATAAREFERMARLDTARPDGLLMLCTAYSKMQQHGRAAAIAGQALVKFPDDARVLARRAQTLIMADDRPSASTLCRRWIEKQPNAAEPRRLLGSIARVELRHAEAVRFCGQALDLEPRNPIYCRELAQALLGEPSAGNLERAAEVLRRAIDLAPDEAETRFLLGDVLVRQEQWTAAREQYLRGTDLNPTDRKGALGLSQLCTRLGETARVSFYGQVVRALQEREDGARGLWRRVFQMPENAEAHSRLATLLLEAGELEQSRHQLAQAVALQPERKAEQRQLAIITRLLELRELTPDVSPSTPPR
jgi:tetratricopeptide (TPR) repeat protein